MEIIKNIAATEAKTWETLATAIDNNFSELLLNINSKQPSGDYALKSELPDVSLLATKTELNTKQEILKSGINIKTVNGQSLLGEGNIEIQGGEGGSIVVDSEMSDSSTNPVQNKIIKQYIDSKSSQTYENFAAIEASGETDINKIYIDAETNTSYRYDGSKFVSIGGDKNEWTLIYSDIPIYNKAKVLTVKDIDYENYTITFNEDISDIKIDTLFHSLYNMDNSPALSIPSGLIEGIYIKEIVNNNTAKIKTNRGTYGEPIANIYSEKVDFTKFYFAEHVAISISIPQKYRSDYDIKIKIEAQYYNYILYGPYFDNAVLKSIGDALSFAKGYINVESRLIRLSQDKSLLSYYAKCIDKDMTSNSFKVLNKAKVSIRDNITLPAALSISSWDHTAIIKLYVKPSNYTTHEAN